MFSNNPAKTIKCLYTKSAGQPIFDNPQTVYKKYCVLYTSWREQKQKTKIGIYHPKLSPIACDAAPYLSSVARVIVHAVLPVYRHEDESVDGDEKGDVDQELHKLAPHVAEWPNFDKKGIIYNSRLCQRFLVHDCSY